MTIGLPIDSNDSWNSAAHFLVKLSSVAHPITLFPDPNLSLVEQRVIQTEASEIALWSIRLISAQSDLQLTLPAVDVLNYQPGNEDLIQHYGSRFDVIALGHPKISDAEVGRIDRGRIGRVLTHTNASLLLCSPDDRKSARGEFFIILSPGSDPVNLAEMVVGFGRGAVKNLTILLVNNYDSILAPIPSGIFKRTMSSKLDKLQDAISMKVGRNVVAVTSIFEDTSNPTRIAESVESSSASLVLLEMGSFSVSSQFDVNPVMALLLKQTQANLLLVRTK